MVWRRRSIEDCLKKKQEGWEDAFFLNSGQALKETYSNQDTSRRGKINGTSLMTYKEKITGKDLDLEPDSGGLVFRHSYDIDKKNYEKAMKEYNKYDMSPMFQQTRCSDFTHELQFVTLKHQCPNSGVMQNTGRKCKRFWTHAPRTLRGSTSPKLWTMLQVSREFMRNGSKGLVAFDSFLFASDANPSCSTTWSYLLAI